MDALDVVIACGYVEMEALPPTARNYLQYCSVKGSLTCQVKCLQVVDI